LKNVKEVLIKVEEWDKLPFGLPEDIVYEIEGSSNLKEHKYNLHDMKEMFDLKFGELFPANGKS
jgi:hypothetical protein